MRLIGAILLVSLVLVLSSCGGSSHSAAPPQGPIVGDADLYFFGGNAVEGFVNKPDGTLQQIVGDPFFDASRLAAVASPDGHVAFESFAGNVIQPLHGPAANLSCPAIATGTNPVALAIAPNQKFVFAANSTSSNISVYSIAANTTCLTAQGTFAADSGPHELVADRSNGFLYVVTSANGIDAFSIDPGTGALTRLPASGFNSGSGTMADVFASPTADLLVATDGGGSNVIHVLQINTVTGALTPIAGSPFAAGGTSPSGMAMNAAGTMLFVANTGSNNVGSFSVAAGGGLSAAAGSPFNCAPAPVDVKLDPQGKFLYVGSSGFTTGSVIAFNVGAGGQLSALNTLGAGTLAGPDQLIVVPHDPSVAVPCNPSTPPGC